MMNPFQKIRAESRNILASTSGPTVGTGSLARQAVRVALLPSSELLSCRFAPRTSSLFASIVVELRHPTSNAPDEPMSVEELRRQLQQDVAEAMSLAPLTIEAQDMCLHVIERLQTIITHPDTLWSQATLPAINRLAQILKEYIAFLKKNSGRKNVFRLVYNHAVVNQNFDFHDQIDNLLRGFNFSEDAWQERWGGYRDAQLTLLEKLSRDRNQVMDGLNRSDTREQTEALMLFLFEYKKVNSNYTARELKVLNDAFAIVSKFSKNKASDADTWFLPPYDFQYDETPFAWGSYGTVHYGKHGGSDVVVKRAKIANDTDRAMFVKEAGTWFSANQIPNVVRLFGAYHIGAEPYFVCEYAENGTLPDYLFKEENRNKTWRLLLEAGRGLRALHKRNIVHNDLKGNNILVATDGIAKLTDFGLSSQLSDQQALSVMKDVGAIRWKAPEIIMGTSPPSFSSDVYSFAMCIFEAASRTKPWGAAMDAFIAHKVKEGVLPNRPSGVSGGFTDAQWALIESMCAFNPAERISMDKVVSQLEIFRDDELKTILAAPNSTRRRNKPAPDEPSPEPTPENTSQSKCHYLTSEPAPVFMVAASIGDTQTSTERGRQITKYEVHLQLSNGKRKQVWKRYSNFRNLHEYLQRDFRGHMGDFPQFPRRRSIWSTLSKAAIAQRKLHLDEFLKSVISNSHLPLGIGMGSEKTWYKSAERSEVVL